MITRLQRILCQISNLFLMFSESSTWTRVAKTFDLMRKHPTQHDAKRGTDSQSEGPGSEPAETNSSRRRSLIWRRGKSGEEGGSCSGTDWTFGKLRLLSVSW